jgi:CheY-like chemotaxis protein
MPGERILVVDDNPQNLKLAKVLLRSAGFDVHTAIDAEDALRAIDEAPPRLILMDLQLPGMDGLELTRRLKSDPRRSDIVIVALTAYAMKGDDVKALAAGCDGYLAKPFDTEKLVAMVSELLS